jgi:hypothetical protein
MAETTDDNNNTKTTHPTREDKTSCAAHSVRTPLEDGKSAEETQSCDDLCKHLDLVKKADFVRCDRQDHVITMNVQKIAADSSPSSSRSKKKMIDDSESRMRHSVVTDDSNEMQGRTTSASSNLSPNPRSRTLSQTTHSEDSAVYKSWFKSIPYERERSFAVWKQLHGKTPVPHKQMKSLSDLSITERSPGPCYLPNHQYAERGSPKVQIGVPLHGQCDSRPPPFPGKSPFLSSSINSTLSSPASLVRGQTLDQRSTYPFSAKAERFDYGIYLKDITIPPSTTYDPNDSKVSTKRTIPSNKLSISDRHLNPVNPKLISKQPASSSSSNGCLHISTVELEQQLGNSNNTAFNHQQNDGSSGDPSFPNGDEVHEISAFGDHETTKSPVMHRIKRNTNTSRSRSPNTKQRSTFGCAHDVWWKIKNIPGPACYNSDKYHHYMRRQKTAHLQTAGRDVSTNSPCTEPDVGPGAYDVEISSECVKAHPPCAIVHLTS